MQARPVLIDANNLIVRNIMASALSDLQSHGVFTGGIYGALNQLRFVLGQPETLAGRVYAFFDHGVPAARLAAIPTYKHERAERRELLDEDVKEQAFQQILKCWELFPLLGITCLAFKDREADDGVAAAARVLATKHCRPVVLSSDADLYQCVALGADVYDLSRKERVTPDNFRALTGTDPWTYVLFRLLVGDTSDSIKGAAGCGPKRAAALLDEVAEEYDGTLGTDSFEDLPPADQLDWLVAQLRTVVKPRKFEEAILADHVRLATVLPGIDLRASFGGLRGLRKALAQPPTLDARGFLRACKGLGMQSVLGDPERYLRPFREALARA